MAGHGGVASAVGGLCPHAKAALEHIDKKTAKRAKEVKGDGWDYAAAKEEVETQKKDGYLSVLRYSAIMAMMEEAEESGLWPVYETEAKHYVVRDARTRTSEHGYACVKHDLIDPDKSSRRLTSGRGFMCRVRLQHVGSLERLRWKLKLSLPAKRCPPLKSHNAHRASRFSLSTPVEKLFGVADNKRDECEHR